jgi:hypothetical protein
LYLYVFSIDYYKFGMKEFHNLLTRHTGDSVFATIWLIDCEFSIISIFMRNVLSSKNMDHIMRIILCSKFINFIKITFLPGQTFKAIKGNGTSDILPCPLYLCVKQSSVDNI